MKHCYERPLAQVLLVTIQEPISASSAEFDIDAPGTGYTYGNEDNV